MHQKLLYGFAGPGGLWVQIFIMDAQSLGESGYDNGDAAPKTPEIMGAPRQGESSIGDTPMTVANIFYSSPTMERAINF